MNVKQIATISFDVHGYNEDEYAMRNCIKCKTKTVANYNIYWMSQFERFTPIKRLFKK